LKVRKVVGAADARPSGSLIAHDGRKIHPTLGHLVAIHESGVAQGAGRVGAQQVC